MKRTLLPLVLAASLQAADSTTPGEISTPFPTLQHLAVEWRIEGDDDLDARCTVKHRQAGATDWQEGPALQRVPAGTSRGTSQPFSWTNRLSGSLFDLEPGTTYEIELTLDDPDGGSATRRVHASTRPEPVAAADARVRPGGRADLNAVQPGEVLLLADGDYGAVTFNRDGKPGQPIVYRSTSGRAVFREISLTNRQRVYLEGVTVHGPVRLNGSEHCVVRRCTIQSQFGIKAYKPGMMNACIEDNVITGIREWKPEIMGAGGDNDGEGIQFTGSGNVIRHNRVRGFRDGISHMEDDGAAPQMCNDILNNDIDSGLDDGIEADFAMHNCRILRNRLSNCFVGISSQPGLGGPNYFLRNVMFNIVLTPFKLHRFSQGDIIQHNTVVKAGDAFGIYTSEPFDHARIEHNLFIGSRPPADLRYGGYSPGRGRGVDLQNFGAHCVIDYNTYAVIGLPFEGKIRSRTFDRLPGPEFEKHGRVIEVDLPVPADPARHQAPPDLSDLNTAGAYAGEAPPHYGPRDH
jgi:hypothetical protein